MEIIRLPEPHGKCVEDDEAPQTVYSNSENSAYSIAACQKSCLQTNIVKECGCGWFGIPLPQSAKNISICNVKTRDIGEWLDAMKGMVCFVMSFVV